MTVGFRFTSADLARMPDIEGVHYEIIDGDLHVSRQPDEAHQYACSALGFALHGWSLRSGAGLTVPAPGLLLADDADVSPDLVWISHGRRATARDDRGHYRLAPELVVEVLSPGPVNERRDRELKLALYARYGVMEYWIVDWQKRLVEIYRPRDGLLSLAGTLSDDGVLDSPVLPGFACSVSSLWIPAAPPE
jgi:Uma2 family endonuclease